jgi:serine/threonine-protein kinase
MDHPGVIVRPNQSAISRLLEEQSAAWAWGEPTPVESLLERDPGLRGDSEVILDLIYHEWLLRTRAGDPVVPNEYRLRFPDLADKIETVFSVFRAINSSARPDGDQAEAEPARNSPTQALRILKLHAEGGLGEVYVARDDQLCREVALKQLKKGLVQDSASRARFVREAEITGRLEHPGIIPVYALGQDDERLPYYTMRLIRGHSLKDAIACFHSQRTPDHDGRARPHELRALLRSFIDVCNAVAYAHSRGVLHRDLKPANVLIGPYGETLLVDWGLAKATGAADPEHALRPESTGECEATIPGAALGTPAYMSPEQADGRLEEIGPASDVYSLGATLYCILTGKPPFEGRNLDQVLADVRKGAFMAPRAVDASISRPLEAICLKAMSRRPGDRYESPRALADDVERWSAGEPAAAYPEPWPVRLRRTVARHRTPAVGLAATLICSLVALTGFAAIVTRKNLELDRKNVQLVDKNLLMDAKNRELELANRELDQKNRELEEERGRASYNEGLAIDAVKRFRDTVQSNSELKSHAELGALRKSLLKEPLEFFRQLRDRLRADLDTRLDHRRKLANATYELAATTAEIGNVADSIGLFSESIKLFDCANSEAAADEALDRSLAASHSYLGMLLHDTGRLEQALEAHNRALVIRERLARRDPKHSLFRGEVGISYNNVGAVLRASGRHDEALVMHRRAIDVLEAVNRDDPTAIPFQAQLALSHSWIGILLADRSSFAEALESHSRALAIRQRLAREHPANSRFQGDLATTHNNIGYLLGLMGRVDESLESLERALTVRDRLARDNPSAALLQSDKAQAQDNLGITLRSAGRRREAREAFALALKTRERIVEEHPGVPGYRSTLGGSLNNLAVIEIDEQRLPQARAYLERAIDHQRAALATSPDHPDYRQFLVQHLRNLATVERALGRPVDSSRYAREMAALMPRDPVELYNVACYLAESARIASGELKSELAAESVRTLRQAVSAGWSDAAHAARDGDLVILQARPDFRQLVAELFDRRFPRDPFDP